jgi:capsular polysaccharide biosynthesis protein
MRERLPVLAGAAAGLVAAIVLTLLQASVYRADASIALVRQGQPPGDDPALAQAAEAAAELFHSRAVADPAIANLRLEESPDELLDRVSVGTEAESSLVRVSVEAPSRDEARRTAQELVEVATVLYNDRFGSAVSASIWEKPRGQSGRVAPRPARNLALGALLGALVGWAVVAGHRRPPPKPNPEADDPIWERLAAVTARELAVARREAQISLRVRELKQGVRTPELEASPEPEPEPESELEPEPELEPELAVPFVRPRPGEWTVSAVEQLLAEHGHGFPDLLEELGYYLESLRAVAGPDGKLPGGVEVVVEDVFSDLLSRAQVGRG